MALQHTAAGLLLMAAGGALANDCCCVPSDQCAWSLSPQSLIFDCNAQTGAFNVNVTTGNNCGWEAFVTSGGDFITIISGSSGSASGTIGIELEGNVGVDRTGQITVLTTVVSSLGPIGSVIGIFDISQLECNGEGFPPPGELPPGGSCAWGISPTAADYDCASQVGFFNVITNTGCGWEASVILGGSFVTITSGATGSDSGTVNFSIGPNIGSSRAAQIQVVTTVVSPYGPIGTLIGIFNILQFDCAGIPGSSCSWKVTPLWFPAFPPCQINTGQSQVITYAGCSWEATVLTGGAYITITSGATGLSSGTIVYEVAANNDGAIRVGVIEVRTLTLSAFGPIGTLINSITIPQDTCAPLLCTGGLALTYQIVGYFDCLLPECVLCVVAGVQPVWTGEFTETSPCVYHATGNFTTGFKICDRGFGPFDGGSFQLQLDPGVEWDLHLICFNAGVFTVWRGRKTYGATPAGNYTFYTGCAGGPATLTLV